MDGDIAGAVSAAWADPHSAAIATKVKAFRRMDDLPAAKRPRPRFAVKSPDVPRLGWAWNEARRRVGMAMLRIGFRHPRGPLPTSAPLLLTPWCGLAAARKLALKAACSTCVDRNSHEHRPDHRMLLGLRPRHSA